jgi:group I intron endonuclease
MSKVCGIYKIVSPSGRVYIGKSVNIKNRFRSYKHLRKQSIGRYLYHSFEKYGVDNHVFEILHQTESYCPDWILKELEKHFIALYKDLGHSLLNLTNGGDGSLGYKHLEESKQQMRIDRIGTFAGIDNPNYGKGLKRELNGMWGKTHSNEAVAKIINTKKNRDYSQGIVQLNIEGLVLNEYKTATEAANFLNIKRHNIICALNKHRQTAFGYVWRYKSEINE